jgi:hypothetical protein
MFLETRKSLCIDATHGSGNENSKKWYLPIPALPFARS